MSFWALPFIFDEIPSETYGLFLISNGGAGVITSSGSNSVEPYIQEIYRRPVPYFFGTQQTPTLSFTLSFASLTPINALNQQLIQKWLFGHNTYKKLQILQCDMYNLYFNCILTEPQITTVGNYPYYFTCNVICDAPWAWEFPKKISYTKFNNDGIFIFNNISDNNYYMYPTISITTNNATTSFTLTNLTDNSYCTFSNLEGGETITIDSDRCVIKSDTGLLRLKNMTGILPRFVPGINKMQITSGVDEILISYQNAKKVAG